MPAAVCAVWLGTAPTAARTPEPVQHQPHFQAVYSPVIPDSITFCGENVNLTRTDAYERYDRELTSLIYGHSNTMLTLKRANKYFPEMSRIVKEAGVPQDVLYLACVESYLNPRAVSPAKAAGLWQMIPSAARQYGLEVSDEVDERYNTAKATQAAMRYLKQAYAKYGNWPTAMASYNAGQGRVSSELDRQGVDTSMDLYLNDETSRYVFRIMATKAIMEHPQTYGFHIAPAQFYMPVPYTEVEVTGPVADWAEWAREHGITYLQLRDENPWIRARQLTNKDHKRYVVRVPVNGSTNRADARRNIFNHNWIAK